MDDDVVCVSVDDDECCVCWCCVCCVVCVCDVLCVSGG